MTNTVDIQGLIDAINQVALHSRDNGIKSFDTVPVRTLAEAIAVEYNAAHFRKSEADRLRQRISALRPWPEGEQLIQGLERLADTVLQD